MRILNQINYLGGLGADRWIGGGWKSACEELGHEFFWYTAADDLAARVKEVKPDILITSQSELGRGHLQTFLDARREGIKVVLRVDEFFNQDPAMLDALTHKDPADLYFGEAEDPNMDEFKRVTKKPYVIIANAAYRPERPGRVVEKYKADIVFLGAMLPKKKEMFEKLLFPLMKRYKVRVYGPGWTLKDNAMRIASRLAREAGLIKLNAAISHARMSVPPDEECDLYSSAKICVNIHERLPGTEILDHLILNERTFKIPACGGFEVCDFVPPVRRYFTEEEMVMADNKHGDWKDDWFKKIDYYMAHDAERKAIRVRGTARALRDHLYVNRVRQMFELLAIK